MTEMHDGEPPNMDINTLNADPVPRKTFRQPKQIAQHQVRIHEFVNKTFKFNR
jgi:hypothetical protein